MAYLTSVKPCVGCLPLSRLSLTSSSNHQINIFFVTLLIGPCILVASLIPLEDLGRMCASCQSICNITAIAVTSKNVFGLCQLLPLNIVSYGILLSCACHLSTRWCSFGETALVLLTIASPCDKNVLVELYILFACKLSLQLPVVLDFESGYKLEKW